MKERKKSVDDYSAVIKQIFLQLPTFLPNGPNL